MDSEGLHRWEVGWHDPVRGDWVKVTSILAADEIGAVAEAEWSLLRKGRYKIYVRWLKGGSKVMEVV